jgi:drug/metabolite transporter (DMT)-like permease
VNLQVNSVVLVQIFVAVALALASAVCYSAAAVLQHREVSVHLAGGLDLVARLVRRRGWWAAGAATGIGAVLHLAALGTGPLLLVQPLGVTALVFALLIDARMDRTPVDRTAWLGAGCVVLGLPAVLLPVIPRHTAPVTPVLGYWAVAAAVAVVTGVLAIGAILIGRRLPRASPVLYAGAAAVCFGLTSGTAKAVWLGHATPYVIVTGLASALIGVVLVQHAYRDGGLGAPLAILTLADPLAAGMVGVLVLGEQISTSPLQVSIGLAGVLSTAVGVVLLSPRHVVPAPPTAAHAAPRPLSDARPTRSAA